MAWQLFSPDLPFLNHITVVQTKSGFWENALSYTPAVSTFFSGVGIFFAYQIASKARAISAEQKEIAKRKLEFDLFDRRMKIIQTHFNILSRVSHKKIIKHEELESQIDDLFDMQPLIICLFNADCLE
ncbi:hypothetical protein, partial [Acetobacter orientalis]|uniref:hypothetical protein n=1 Tax=Acetobacter orientalis TaxID=146474 RepID=UPI0039EBCAEB